jgi:hypothetical protein
MIDVKSYAVTDAQFGAPYIDKDEEVGQPAAYRHIHGGFEGTDTRFRFYFPSVANGYKGRMFNPLSGAHGGTEDFFSSPFGEAIGGLSMCFRLGGYMIESNQGHIGDEIDAKGGEDATLYGHRASAEVARFSKFVAAQIYGAAPHHSYVFGGSGGGRRSPLCLENCPGVWDGALPFMGGGDIAEPGNTKRVKGAQNISFATMFNVQRLLGDKLVGVVDAMAPGGTGEPYAGLDTHEREELASLYRQGFPRHDEFMIGEQMGQIWLWSATADMLYEQDPAYFENFWTKPGYVGHDMPSLVTGDLIDIVRKVKRVITVQDVVDGGVFTAPEYADIRAMAFRRAMMGRADIEFGVELEPVGPGYRLGVGLRVISGKATGRQLYATEFAGESFFCDGMGEANILRFSGVEPGDEVHVDNHRYLAYCYWARHHLLDEHIFDSFRVDGAPIYPQHSVPDQSSMMGVAYSGQYEGKLMWVHHTLDSSLWPPQGVVYAQAVAKAQGAAVAGDRFRLRWTQNAEHVPPSILPNRPGRATNTWLVDYQPVIEQSLADLVTWVEEGTAPAGTSYEYQDGQVSLPSTALDRGGIQPVVTVSANGSLAAHVRVGEPVSLQVHAEVPPGAGAIISATWDFDGNGTYPFCHDDIDGSASEVTRTHMHTYDAPGTYFAAALVCSHRDGDMSATSRRIPNVARARIVVS